jgi:hypothetical protein
MGSATSAATSLSRDKTYSIIPAQAAALASAVACP